MSLFVLFSLTLLTAASVATRTCMRRSTPVRGSGASISAPARIRGSRELQRHREASPSRLPRRLASALLTVPGLSGQSFSAAAAHGSRGRPMKTRRSTRRTG